MSRIQTIGWSLLWLCLLLAAKSLAADDATPEPLAPFSTILARIHDHAADKAWRANGWKDEQIELWLERLTARIATAANTPWLRLPVRFADIKPTDEADPRSLDRTLRVGRNFRLVTTKLRNCIVLADGNFLADSVQSCIVIARGAVSVSSSDSSIIVAGAYARTGSDGQSRSVENGSLFLTPGWANLDVINGSVVLANEGINTGRQLNGGIFLNASLVYGDGYSSTIMRRPRTLKVRDLPIGDLVNDPLSSQLEVSGVIYPEPIEAAEALAFGMRPNRNKPRPRPTGLLLRFQDRRYIVNIGQPIVDQHEQPVAGLAGWKLSYLNDHMAIFSRGQADAIVRIEEP